MATHFNVRGSVWLAAFCCLLSAAAVGQADQPALDGGMMAYATDGPQHAYDPESQGEWSAAGCSPAYENDLGYVCQPPCVAAVPQLYGEVSYLLWWIQDGSLPPLVATSPAGTLRTDAGVLGSANAVTLSPGSYGGGRADGLRARVGGWLDANATTGIEATWFSLGDITGDSDFSYASDAAGSPIIARPFLDPSTGVEASELVAFPSIVSGIVSAEFDSELNSAAIVLRRNLNECEGSRVDFTAGYRYFGYDESLRMTENLTSIDTGGFIAVGTTFDLEDHFQTETDFHGAQLGLIHSLDRGPLTFVTRGSVALGSSRMQRTTSGSTTVTVPTVAPVTTAGGLLAQPTNIGTASNNEFAVLPEVGVDVQCRLTHNVTATFGYSFAYLSEAMRVGEQLDRTVNSTQIGGGILAGEARPAPAVISSDLWVQGLQFGVELEW